METIKLSNRKSIEKEAMKRFGMCQYKDMITHAPKTEGKRFVRSYWVKGQQSQGSQRSQPVAKLYIYESTGKVYLKDYLKNETITNDHGRSYRSEKQQSQYTQQPLF